MTLALLRYTPIVEWHLGPLSISPHGLGTAITVVALCAWLLPRHRTPDPNTTTPCSRVPRANQENRHE